MMIHPDELTKLEQELDRSALDDPTKNVIKGVIAARKILVGVLERLLETPEDSRDEIFQELAEMLALKDSSQAS
jgi:hypothetical protein